MFLKPLPSTKAKEKKSVFEIGESEVFPSFRLNYDFLECFKKPLSLATTRKRRSDTEKMAKASQEKIASTSLNADEVPASVDSVVRYTEEELTAFKENMASENTKKSTGTSVRRLQSWYMEKYQTELNLNSISKTEAPRLLKHFFVEIRQTTNENKGKEYEPGTLQTYRNGLRRYFLERVCPPAPDNFDIDNFEDIATMLSVKKKDLKKKGFGNKPNAAQPMECPYVRHRPNGEKVPRNFFLTPVENPTSNVWYKMVPVGRNKLAKQMQEIASFASLDGKFTNSSGRKTVIQSLRDEFHPLEISELTGHADPGSIASYSHNPLEKQRRMSNKLAGFSSAVTTTTNANRGSSTQVLREVTVNSPALRTTVENNTTTINDDDSHSAFTARALGGLFSGVTFTNSPVNISISFQSNLNK